LAATDRGRTASGHRSPVVPAVALAIVLLLVGGSVSTSFGPVGPARAGSPHAAPALAPVRGDARPLTTVLGDVAATVNLVNGTVATGNVAPLAVRDPHLAAYLPHFDRVVVADSTTPSLAIVDPASGSVERTVATTTVTSAVVEDPTEATAFLAEGTSDRVAVLDEASQTVIAIIAVGTAPVALAYDPGTDAIFVANQGSDNVSVISGASASVVGTIAVGVAPSAIAYDPTSDRVYVANNGSANVSVIDPGLLAVAGSIAVGSGPAAFAVDPAHARIAVADTGSDDVTLINTTLGSVAASLPVGGGPCCFAVLPGLDRLVVADPATLNVSVINTSSDTLIGNVSLGLALGASPRLLAADTTQGTVVVGSVGAPHVVVVDPATLAVRSVVATAGPYAFGHPQSITVDPGRDGVYVANSASAWALQTGNLTVLHGATNYSTTSIPLSLAAGSVAVDPSGATVAVAVPNAAAVDLLDATTGSVRAVVAVGANPSSMAFDATTGDLYVANAGDGSVSVVDPVTATVVTTVAVGYNPIGIVDDPDNGRLYVADALFGTIYVLNATGRSVVGSIATPGFNLTAIAYDPSVFDLFVTDGSTNAVYVVNVPSAQVTVTLAAGSRPASVVYDPDNGYLYVGNAGSGNVTVLDGALLDVIDAIPFVTNVPLAYDPLRGWLAGANASLDAVAAFGLTNRSLADPVPVGATPDGLAFSPLTGSLYVANFASGTVSVVATGPPTPESRVTFLEFGLPVGTPWTVHLGGYALSSADPSVVFQVPNGTYAYAIANAYGFAATPGSGSIVANGSPINVSVTFAPIVVPTYNVTFQESGLAAGVAWTITFNGTPATVQAPSSLAFIEPNGSYPYTVTPIVGYNTTILDGNVTVVGGDVTVTIDWTPRGAGGLVATLRIDPAAIMLGASVWMNASVTGGTPPYRYAYSNLPDGCATADTPSLACTPNGSGTWTVSLTATDANGTVARATAGLSVATPEGGSGPVSSQLLFGPLVLALVALAVVAIVIVAIVVAVRRRRPPTDGGAMDLPAEPEPVEATYDPPTGPA